MSSMLEPSENTNCESPNKWTGVANPMALGILYGTYKILLQIPSDTLYVFTFHFTNIHF